MVLFRFFGPPRFWLPGTWELTGKLSFCNGVQSYLRVYPSLFASSVRRRSFEGLGPGKVFRSTINSEFF